jgi:hypothetical protein
LIITWLKLRPFFRFALNGYAEKWPLGKMVLDAFAWANIQNFLVII